MAAGNHVHVWSLKMFKYVTQSFHSWSVIQLELFPLSLFAGKKCPLPMDSGGFTYCVQTSSFQFDDEDDFTSLLNVEMSCWGELQWIRSSNNLFEWTHSSCSYLLWACFLMWPQTDFLRCSYMMFHLAPSVLEGRIPQPRGQDCQVIKGLPKGNYTSRPPVIYFFLYKHLTPFSSRDIVAFMKLGIITVALHFISL